MTSFSQLVLSFCLGVANITAAVPFYVYFPYFADWMTHQVLFVLIFFFPNGNVSIYRAEGLNHSQQEDFNG